MQYTTLPGTELRVSRVAFGCMSTVLSQTYEGLGDDEAVRTMHRAIDLGINFFDTARMYGDGRSEEILGRAIRGIREKVVIASKPAAGTLSRDEIISECEKSLRSLGVDHIDLYQIHWPKHVVPMEETARAMVELKEAGKIGAIGVCNFGPQDLSEFLEHAPCATDQLPFSLLSRAVEYEVQDMCIRHDLGILCYSPLAQGLLAGRYASADEVPSGRARTRHFASSRPEARHGEPGCEQETFEAVGAVREIAADLRLEMADLALAWLLHRPCVSAVLAGASRPEQVDRNARAAEVRLDDEALERLDRATAPVKERLGPSLDMWATPPRTR